MPEAVRKAPAVRWVLGNPVGQAIVAAMAREVPKRARQTGEALLDRAVSATAGAVAGSVGRVGRRLAGQAGEAVPDTAQDAFAGASAAAKAAAGGVGTVVTKAALELTNPSDPPAEGQPGRDGQTPAGGAGP